MTEFARWHKRFCLENGHKPDAWDAWHGALQYIKESRPNVRKAVQQTKYATYKEGFCPVCNIATYKATVNICPSCGVEWK
jgi:hypothetical protein